MASPKSVVFFARGEQRCVAGFGDDYFLPTVFFLAGFLAAAFFTGAFLAADFFLAGIRFPPFPLATAKIGENHVNNSLLAVNSSLRKRRQRIFFDFRLIFFATCTGWLAGWCSRSKISSALATISSTFQRRPRPSYPQASIPSSGPIKVAPRALSVATFCCVAGCNHILPFIAGAMRTGACVARAMEVRTSSQIPSASLART